MVKIADVERAADSLRRFEMAGRVLMPWASISKAQRSKWIEKAETVLEAAGVYMEPRP